MAKKVTEDFKNKRANAFVNVTKENSQIVKYYIDDIMKYRQTTEEEELLIIEKIMFGREAEAELAESKNIDSEYKKILEGIIADAENAKNEFITRNQRFVYTIAKQYAQDDNLLPDLISEGNIGFKISLDKYEPSKGAKICTLANWYITRSISEYIKRYTKSVVKTNNTKYETAIKRETELFMAKEERMPMASELVDIIKEKYNMDIKDESDVYDLCISSINCCYDDEDKHAFENSQLFSSHTSVGSEDVYDENQVYATEVLNQLLSNLDERTQYIVSHINGLCGAKFMTAEEIGFELGIGSERVRQIAKNAVKKMQNYASQVKSF